MTDTAPVPPRESTFLVAPLPADVANALGATLRTLAARVAFAAGRESAGSPPPPRLGLCAVAAGGDRLRVKMQILVKPSPTLDLRDWMTKTSALPTTPSPSSLAADPSRTAAALRSAVDLATSRGASIHVLAPCFANAKAYDEALTAAAAAGASVTFVALAVGAGAAAAPAVATLAAFDAGLEPYDAAVVTVVPPDPHALAAWGGVVARDALARDARCAELRLPGGRAGAPAFVVPLLAQTEVLPLDGALTRVAACPCHAAPVAAAGGDWRAALCASTRAPLPRAACAPAPRHMAVGGLPLKLSAKAAGRVRDPPGGDAVLPPWGAEAAVARAVLTAVAVQPLASVNDGLLFGTPFYLVADDAGDAPLAALCAALRARAAGLVVTSRADVAAGIARSLTAHYLLRPADDARVPVLLGRRLAAGDERLPLTVEAGDGAVPPAVAAAADAALDALPQDAPCGLSSGAAALLASLAASCVTPDAPSGLPQPAEPLTAAAARGRGLALHHV